MDITYDAAKSESNRAKHGISLELAHELDWSAVMAYPDTRHDYRELP